MNDTQHMHTTNPHTVNVFIAAVTGRLHMTHCALGLFAELETGERYTELRHLYNRMKPAGFDVAPPYEEFRGMDDICHHIFCRWVAVEFRCRIPL